MKKFITLIVIGVLFVGCASNDDETTMSDDMAQQEEECDAVTQLFAENIFLTQFDVSFNFSGNIVGFNLEYGEAGFVKGQGVLVENISTFETIHANLIGDTEYEFYVSSICLDGTMVDSDRKSFTTPVCPVPTINDVINITETSALVRFSENSFVGAYEVEYGPTNFSIGSGTVITAGNNQQAQLNGLTGGTLYDVYVRTNCGGVFGAYSSRFTFESTPLCFTPTDLDRTNITSTTVRLTWNPNGETAWQIQYGLVGFILGTGTTISTSNRPYTVQNLNNNTTYEFYIRANCGSDGFSNWSESIVITTE